MGDLRGGSAWSQRLLGTQSTGFHLHFPTAPDEGMLHPRPARLAEDI